MGKEDTPQIGLWGTKPCKSNSEKGGDAFWHSRFNKEIECRCHQPCRAGFCPPSRHFFVSITQSLHYFHNFLRLVVSTLNPLRISPLTLIIPCERVSLSLLRKHSHYCSNTSSLLLLWFTLSPRFIARVLCMKTWRRTPMHPISSICFRTLFALFVFFPSNPSSFTYSLHNGRHCWVHFPWMVRYLGSLHGPCSSPSSLIFIENCFGDRIRKVRGKINEESNKFSEFQKVPKMIKSPPIAMLCELSGSS